MSFTPKIPAWFSLLKLDVCRAFRLGIDTPYRDDMPLRDGNWESSGTMRGGFAIRWWLSQPSLADPKGAVSADFTIQLEDGWVDIALPMDLITCGTDTATVKKPNGKTTTFRWKDVKGYEYALTPKLRQGMKGMPVLPLFVYVDEDGSMRPVSEGA